MMSFKFNSKVIAVAVFFASINMSASSVRANQSQSLLSNDRSLGVTLLSQEENSNYGDAAVAPDSAADAAVAPDAAAANATDNNVEGNSEEKRVEFAKIKADFFAKNPNATLDDFENSLYAPTQQEIEFKKNLERQLAGDPPGVRAMVEIIAKENVEAINKMENDFKAKNPGATIEQVNNYTSEVFKALKNFDAQVLDLKARLFPRIGHAMANDTYEEVMKFSYDYFKERPDEANQAAKEIYLATPNITVPKGLLAEDAQKLYDDFIKMRQEYFKTLE